MKITKQHLRFSLGCVLLITLPLSSIAQSPSGYISDWKNDADGAYTIVHDDYGSSGVDGIWAYADTICANRDITFTIGAISSECESTRNIKGYAGPYDYAKQVMIAQHGHEIMSHSHTHSCAVGNAGWSPCDASVGAAWGENPGSTEFNRELETAHNSIVTNTGFTPAYYIYPFDRFTDDANARLKELGYLGSRTGWTSPAPGASTYHRNGYENNDLASIFPDSDGFFRTSVQVFDDNDNNSSIAQQVSELNGEVDVAIANNMWANRELHNVGSSGWGSVRVDSYRQHIDYLQSKVTAGQLWVATISEVLTYKMQQLKFQPSFSYDAQQGLITVNWNTINPQYNVQIADYLSGRSRLSPITTVVDLDGLMGTWTILQDGVLLTDYTQNGDELLINVFPHQGPLQIYKGGSLPNQKPFVENGIADYTNLMIDFASFEIDLNNVFEDVETADNALLYQVTGNSNILVSISNGIATISSTQGWSGEETLTFTAEDEDEETVSEIVYFNVSDIFNGHTPFRGEAIIIPGRIEAEYYDEGAAEVVYHEVVTNYEPDPSENPFRVNSAVDINDIPGGGWSLAYTESDEWVDYTINVQSSGMYEVTFRIAQNQDGSAVGQIRLFIDNQLWVPTTTMKYTSSWTDFEDVTYGSEVPLSQGSHVLRMNFVTGSVDVDYLDVLGVVTSGANDDFTQNDFTLYPNPASSEFFVKGSYKYIEVFNQLGEKVLETPDRHVRIGNLPDGVYYVKNGLGEGAVKFVKTR